jgi:multiple sugar transport system ATP-binding protein
MGRAIVRSPKAFLMDEPLSNLDAKLRVQMRTEVSRIQQRLETTTVYVTHDQVEAMTLGDRVAVMRAGIIQQVDSPKNLYEHPENLFVAGFIGSPSMNFLPARIEGEVVKLPFGDAPIPQVLRGRLTGDGNREVIAGVRPEHFEDATVEPDRPGLKFSAPVTVVESMGSELYAYFDVASGGVQSAELVELAEDSGISELPRHGGDQQQVVARLDSASRARPGEQANLVLDTEHLMLFDPDGGRSLASTEATAAA